MLLLAAGVAIMVLYVRSGESLVVLMLSLVTLLAIVAVMAMRPWQGAEDAGRIDPAWDQTWRCGHDVTWDQRGIHAVAVGDRLPRLTMWSRVDRITVGQHRSQVDHRGHQRRRGLRLDLYQPVAGDRDGVDQREVWLCLGPDQDPERMAAELSSAWRRISTGRGQPKTER